MNTLIVSTIFKNKNFFIIKNKFNKNLYEQYNNEEKNCLSNLEDFFQKHINFINNNVNSIIIVYENNLIHKINEFNSKIYNEISIAGMLLGLNFINGYLSLNDKKLIKISIENYKIFFKC